jgi:hypothetical protein
MLQIDADLRSSHFLRMLLAMKKDKPSAPEHQLVGRYVGVAVPPRGVPQMGQEFGRFARCVGGSHDESPMEIPI